MEQLAQLVHEVERLVTAPYVPSLHVSGRNQHRSILANEYSRGYTIYYSKALLHRLIPGHLASHVRSAC
jgi:hypothetical protein